MEDNPINLSNNEMTREELQILVMVRTLCREEKLEIKYDKNFPRGRRLEIIKSRTDRIYIALD